MHDPLRHDDRLTASDARLTAFRAEALAERRKRLAAERGWSWARLASFASGVAGWLWLSNVYAVLAAAVFFVVSVRRHVRARAGRAFADSVVEMIAESRRRFGGVMVTIRSGKRPEGPPGDQASPEPVLDSGETWALTDQECDDLDLYAEPSAIFGLINRTSTTMGARRLRDQCERASLAADRIEARQACVRRLDGAGDYGIEHGRQEHLSAHVGRQRSSGPTGRRGHRARDAVLPGTTGE